MWYLAAGHGLQGNPLAAPHRLLLEELELALDLKLLHLLGAPLETRGAGCVMQDCLLRKLMKGLRLTVTGVPLPPTALSWPEARLTPASEAPAMVTGLEVEVPAMELLATTVFTRVAGVRVEGEETSEEPATWGRV